jgi:carboxymethylenebutenolidase
MPNITYPTADGHMPGYLAIPDGVGPWPGIIVVQDVIGVTTDLKRITDRLSANGYVALAPALYGRSPKIKCMISTIVHISPAAAPHTMTSSPLATTSSSTTIAPAKSGWSASAWAQDSVYN